MRPAWRPARRAEQQRERHHESALRPLPAHRDGRGPRSSARNVSRSLLEPAVPGTAPEQITDPAEAAAWFAAERAVLLAVLRQTAQLGFDTHTWQLARAMQDNLSREGYWAEQAGNYQAAVEAGERLGDPARPGERLLRSRDRLRAAARFEEADSNLSAGRGALRQAGPLRGPGQRRVSDGLGGQSGR